MSKEVKEENHIRSADFIMNVIGINWGVQAVEHMIQLFKYQAEVSKITRYATDKTQRLTGRQDEAFFMWNQNCLKRNESQSRVYRCVFCFNFELPKSLKL